MLDALTLDQLRTFAAVAETGSFRAAAARLLRAQSAVSHAIGNLEAELGVSLFDRTGYRPSLTAEGRALLEDTRAILLKVDSLRGRARGLGEGVEVGLSIVVDTLFPMEAVCAALRSVRATYSSVGIRLGIAPLGGPLVALLDKQAMLAITVGEAFRDPHIEVEALSTVAIAAVVAPGHPLATLAERGTRIGSSELRDHLQIVLEDSTTLTQGRDFGVLSPGTWRVTTQEAKHALIRAGIGWGRLPLWQVKRDLLEGRLVQLPAAGLGPEGETVLQAYLAHRVDEPPGPAARVFRQSLLGATDDGPEAVQES